MYTEDRGGIPPHAIDPQKKKENSYGLKVAQYILNLGRYGTAVGPRHQESLEALEDFLFGQNQRVEAKGGPQPKDNDTTLLRELNMRLATYAMKKINIVVTKMAERRYDPRIRSQDPMSEDARLEHESKQRLAMELQALQLGQESSPMQPPEGAKLSLEINYRDEAAMYMEDRIRKSLWLSNYEEQCRQRNLDLVIHGIGMMITEMDASGLPSTKRIHPKRAYLPHVENGNFEDLPWVGWIEYMSLPKLAQESGEPIAKLQRHLGRLDEYGLKVNRGKRQQEAVMVPVLKFRYKTVNKMGMRLWADPYGNLRKTSLPYEQIAEQEPTPASTPLADGSTIIRENEAVYEGWYLPGSDRVFKYGLWEYTERDRGPFSDARIGVQVYAPNLYEGKLQSMGLLMKPILQQVRTYMLKVRELVAKPFSEPVELDLDRLSLGGLRPDGKEWSLTNLLDFIIEHNVIPTRSNKLKPGMTSTIRSVSGGTSILDYMQLASDELQRLDEVTGVNAALSASNLGERAGARATQLQLQSGEVALEHLFFACKTLTQQVFGSLGRLHTVAERVDRTGIYAKTFSPLSHQFMQEHLARSGGFLFDWQIEALPTQAEWDDFMAAMMNLVEKQVVKLSDALRVKEWKSIRRAKAWLQQKEQEALEERAAAEQRNMELNAQVQQQSATMAHQQAMELQALKNEGEAQQVMIGLQKVQGEMKLQRMKHHQEMEKMRLEAQLKDEGEA